MFLLPYFGECTISQTLPVSAMFVLEFRGLLTHCMWFSITPSDSLCRCLWREGNFAFHQNLDMKQFIFKLAQFTNSDFSVYLIKLASVRSPPIWPGSSCCLCNCIRRWRRSRSVCSHLQGKTGMEGVSMFDYLLPYYLFIWVNSSRHILYWLFLIWTLGCQSDKQVQHSFK